MPKRESHTQTIENLTRSRHKNAEKKVHNFCQQKSLDENVRSLSIPGGYAGGEANKGKGSFRSLRFLELMEQPSGFLLFQKKTEQA